MGILKNNEGINSGLSNLKSAMDAVSEASSLCGNFSYPINGKDIESKVTELLDELQKAYMQASQSGSKIQGAAIELEIAEGEVQAYVDSDGRIFLQSGLLIFDNFGGTLDFGKIEEIAKNSGGYKDELEEELIKLGLTREEAKELASTYGEDHWYEEVRNAGIDLFSSGTDVLHNFKGLFTGESSISDLINSGSDFASKVLSTSLVVNNAVKNGVLKLGETLIVDGGSMVLTGVASLATGAYDLGQYVNGKLTGADWSSATKKMWDKEMDFSSIDLVGKSQEYFYENTEMGRYINEHSALKYDSNVVAKIQSASQKVSEIALATGATVVSGGLVAPVVLGFVYGTGEAAEKNFKDEDKRNVKGILSSYLNGVSTAADWYAYGQIGGTVVNNLAKLGTTTATESTKEISGNLLSKSLKKTITSADLYLDTAATLASNTIDTINGEEVTIKDWLSGLAFAFGGNLLGDFIGTAAEMRTTKATLSEKVDSNSLLPSNLKDSNLSGENQLAKKKLDDFVSDFNLDDTAKQLDSIPGNAKAIDIDQVKKEIDNFGNDYEGLLKYVQDNEDIVKTDPSLIGDLKNIPLESEGNFKSYVEFNKYVSNIDSSTTKIDPIDNFSGDLNVKNTSNVLETSNTSDTIRNLDDLTSEINKIGNNPEELKTFIANNKVSLEVNPFAVEVIGLVSHDPDVLKVLDEFSVPNTTQIIKRIDSFGKNYQELLDYAQQNQNLIYSNKEIYNAFLAKCDEYHDIYKSLEWNSYINGYEYYDYIKNLDGANFKFFRDIDTIDVHMIDGRKVYMINIDGKVYFSELDIANIYKNCDDATKEFLENDFLSQSRLLKNAENNNGYLGYFVQDENGAIRGYMDNNFSNQVIEKIATKRDKFFDVLRDNAGRNYGVDQHATGNLFYYKWGTPYGTNEYFRVRNELMSRYGFSELDASQIMTQIDMKDAGACSYASFANEIFYTFSNNPKKFKEIFGYDMFTTLDDGSVVLNSSELITDIYVNVNSIQNGGKLFDLSPNGQAKIIDFNESGYLNIKDQKYFFSYIGDDNATHNYATNYFLQSKSPNMVNNTKILFSKKSPISYSGTLTDQDITRIKNQIFEELKAGNNVSLGIYVYQDDIQKNITNGLNMYNLDDPKEIVNTLSWNEGGGHEVFVTGLYDNGVTVSSWGRKYFITFEELKNNPFDITSSKITY